jgi:NAD-dependent deacetylase
LKKIVVFTGSGISAESGIRTFRDSGGLWEDYAVADVATPQAWNKNPDLVQRFYNERRKQILEAPPNPAHTALAKLEAKYKVVIVTQNIDDLHERAGSSHVIHLHGEITKARSSVDENMVYDISGWEIPKDAVCEKGSKLRPFIVWFGEAVPMMEPAIEQVISASIFLIIGTSLEVYPAAGLLTYANPEIPKYYIDPYADNKYQQKNFTIIKDKAGNAVPILIENLLSI